MKTLHLQIQNFNEPQQKKHEENHKAHYHQIAENQWSRENLKSSQCEKINSIQKAKIKKSTGFVSKAVQNGIQ